MFRYAFAGKFLVCLLIYLINFQVLMCSNQLFSCVSLVLISLANSCYFFVASTINNTFADSEYSGLMITMMASMHNLGNNSTLQLNIISQIGYNTASHIGLSISAVTLLGSNILTKWVEKGEI